MAIDAIVQDAAPKTIVISGPVARGTADGNSDTDTLVVTDPDKRVFDMESERTHNLRALLAAIAPGAARWIRTSSWRLARFRIAIWPRAS